VSTRVTAAAQFVVEDGISVSCAARVLQVSRLSVYVRLRPMSPAGGDVDGLVVDRAAGRRARRLHLVAPVLPEDWQTMDLGPERCDVEVAVHVLARRHPAAGYRKITARARRAGYVLNRKKTARLLKAWGFLRTGRKPHPKAQGKPFDITASNQLWQTDMTSIWCGEDGWGYFTAVIDTYDRVLLGWSFTLRCRALDVSPSLEMAWSTAFPYGIDPATQDGRPTVVVRHDNGTQFTSHHYRGVAATLKLKLSRTAYRHPDGNAFIERMFRTLKEEAIWPNEFDSFDQALEAILAWMIDYNHERPHASLGERTPAEARAEAVQHKTAA
jgi:putative transposase